MQFYPKNIFAIGFSWKPTFLNGSFMNYCLFAPIVAWSSSSGENSILWCVWFFMTFNLLWIFALVCHHDSPFTAVNVDSRRGSSYVLAKLRSLNYLRFLIINISQEFIKIWKEHNKIFFFPIYKLSLLMLHTYMYVLTFTLQFLTVYMNIQSKGNFQMFQLFRIWRLA